MKILAIESSSMVASVAITDNNTLVAEYTINHKKTHSQTLLPMIDEIVKMTETSLETVDAIAVSAGPGSFTGLRIGSATGKGIGLALDIPMIHIPTMDALAYNLYGCKDMICPIMDARRNQVYTGLYEFDGEDFHIIQSQELMQIEELIARINSMGRKVMFLGDGVDTLSSYIMENIAVEYHFAPVHMNKNKASSVAALAQVYYKEGKIENAREHLPDYLRESQAERELKEKMVQNDGNKQNDC